MRAPPIPGAQPEQPERTLRLLVIGDIVGKSGRRAIASHLGGIVRDERIDGVIANAENASGGIGITGKVADELFQAGINVLTTGNHVWKYGEIAEYMALQPRILRPENYPAPAPGRGYVTFQARNGMRVGVLNLMGRVFMDPLECPFRTADQVLERIRQGQQPDALIVDMHAEASSEKMALGHHLDGRVSAVLGTHTHVPTADHHILPRGTGYMTDLGMTGCYHSVIGMRTETVLPRFLSQRPTRFEAEAGDGMLCGVLLSVDTGSRRCLEIRPVRRGNGLSETAPLPG